MRFPMGTVHDGASSIAPARLANTRWRSSNRNVHGLLARAATSPGRYVASFSTALLNALRAHTFNCFCMTLAAADRRAT